MNKNSNSNIVKIISYLIITFIFLILIIYLVNKLMFQGKDYSLDYNDPAINLSDNTSYTNYLINNNSNNINIDNKSNTNSITLDNIEISGNFNGIQFYDDNDEIKNQIINSFNFIMKDFNTEIKNSNNNLKGQYHINKDNKIQYVIKGTNNKNKESYITYNEKLKKNGPFYICSEVVEEKGTFYNNIRQGKYISYYENQYIETGFYDKNMKIGPFKRYNIELLNNTNYNNISDINYYYFKNIDNLTDSNNSNNSNNDFKKVLFAKGIYEFNKISGVLTKYYPDGKISDFINYDLGLKNGPAMHYYNNGNKYSEGNYIFGQKDGNFIFYKYENKEEKPYAELVYKKGNITKAVCKTNNKSISIKINNPSSIELDTPMDFCKNK